MLCSYLRSDVASIPRSVLSVAALQKGAHLLRGCGGSRCTARRRRAPAGVRAVENHTRAPLEADPPAVLVFDRCLARADVAAALAFGRRGRQQQLLGTQPPQ